MPDRPLPEFTVRRSPRARRVRLSVTPRDGLVVIVPERMRVDAGAVVRSKLGWAQRALDRVADRRSELAAGAEALLPSRVELAGIGWCSPVEYRATESARMSARTVDGTVIISGDVDDADACLLALRRWLAATAAAHLPARVAELAALHGLSPSRVRVGGARTRWGSCSARGTISLSRNSAFLPTHLLDALILHELAHLKVLDHSPRFWAVLTEMDAHAAEHRRQLKSAEALVPAWAAC